MNEELKDKKEKIARKKNILEKINLSEDECNRIYDEFETVKKHLRYFSIIQQVCRLNPNASYSQEDLLKGLFGFDDATIKKYVFEKEYTEEDLKFYGEHAIAMDLKEKKSFVDLLFKLAIVLDGIHNDEWKLLMQIVADFKFNKNYINLFIRRYGPLRTEFEDERKDSTSTGERTVAFLNPYYAILGLDISATEEEIKKAYHALALEHHPDLPKNAGRIQECEEMMAKINEAYEKIRD
ncbi:MAG: J domain-containing protein [Bacteroidales bacterium]|nr:J domain-containing protein [Candidatus Scybalocola fimicaballi]